MKMLSTDYSTCKENLLVLACKKGFEHISLPLPSNKSLSIDVFTYGKKDAPYYYIHSSGVHGVEGFIGSGIQAKIITEFDFESHKDIFFIFIHGINPHGMKELRRWNQDNIDLNRNFNISELKNLPQNPMYEKIDSLINPQTQHELKYFKLKALFKILKHGFSTLKQATAQGQYQYPKGIFYGGKKESENVFLLKSFLDTLLSPQKIMMVDVHTGLGGYGKENLFLEGFLSNEVYQTLLQSIGKPIIHVRNNESTSYNIHGGWINYISLHFSSSKLYALTQEIGTKPALYMIDQIVKENYFYHYDKQNPTYSSIRKELLKSFMPEDKKWQNNALDKGLETFSLLINTIHKSN